MAPEPVAAARVTCATPSVKIKVTVTDARILNVPVPGDNSLYVRVSSLSYVQPSASESQCVTKKGGKSKERTQMRIFMRASASAASCGGAWVSVEDVWTAQRSAPCVVPRSP